jgi:ketosteroid isomerase-like protein
MDNAEALLTKVYEAYNRRDFAVFSAFLTSDVDWPNQLQGGRVRGRDAVAALWRETDQSIQVDLAPVTFALETDGRVAVNVNQIVRNLGGQIWSDSCVRHVFTVEDGMIARLDVEPLDGGT